MPYVYPSFYSSVNFDTFIILTFFLSLSFNANPKSPNLTLTSNRSLLSKKIFKGFKSRCIKLCE